MLYRWVVISDVGGRIGSWHDSSSKKSYVLVNGSETVWIESVPDLLWIWSSVVEQFIPVIE